MTDAALAKQIAVTMATIHRANKKLCGLLSEAASRAHLTNQIDAETFEEVVQPKDDEPVEP